MEAPIFTLPKPFATLYADKYMSAKVTTFADKITLKKYLMGEVVYDRMTSPKLTELVDMYNEQNNDYIKTN